MLRCEDELERTEQSGGTDYVIFYLKKIFHLVQFVISMTLG